MAKHINRREAERRIADLVNLTRGRCPTWDEVHEVLYDLPFVELVRCKDCNFLEKNTGVVHFPKAVGICKKLGIYPSGDWFCANGVKKE